MTKTRLQVWALALTLAAIGSAAGVARDKDDAALAEVSGYKRWARVTGQPMPVEFASPAG